MGDTIKQLATYAGSVISIGLGVALIWAPPATIAGDGGTFLTAGAFITGGLAALGVTVTLPAVRAQARAEGEARAARRP